MTRDDPAGIQGLGLVIPSRHPVQLWLMVGFAVAALFQLVQGPSVTAARIGLPDSVWYTQAAVLGLAAVQLLASAAVAERAPWDSVGLSLGGMITATSVMAFYVWLTCVATPGLGEFRTGGLWFIAALGCGFAHRAVQLAFGALRLKVVEWGRP